MTHNIFQIYNPNIHYKSTKYLQVYLTIKWENHHRLITTVVKVLDTNDDGMIVQSLFPLFDFDYPARFLFLYKNDNYGLYSSKVQNCEEIISKIRPEAINSYEIGLAKYDDKCVFCQINNKNVILRCGVSCCIQCFYKHYWFNSINGYCSSCRKSQNCTHFTVLSTQSS